jgi:Flp pilus assembly protein TadG
MNELRDRGWLRTKGPGEARVPFRPGLRGLRLPRRLSLRRESGQGVVEFGLVIPLLAALVFSLVNFAKVINYWIDVTQVASEGARIAAVNANVDIDSTLRNQLITGELRGSGTTIAVCYPSGTSAGNPVTVQVARAYHVPFYGNLSITSRATMRLEQNATHISATGSCT